MTSLGPVITYDEPYRWSEEMPSEWRRRLRVRSADEMLARLEDEWGSEFPPLKDLRGALSGDRREFIDKGICVDCRINRADRITRCDACNQKMINYNKQRRAMKQVA